MDNEFLKSLLYMGSVGAIAGLVQVLKPLVTNPKWYGILAVIIGIALNLLITWALTVLLSTGAVITGILYGIIAGLAASGAYSTGQTQQGKIVVDPKEVTTENKTEVK